MRNTDMATRLAPARGRWAPVFAACALLLITAALRAEDDTAFARVSEDGDGNPRALQMAIVTYVPAAGQNGVSVDLIGAVHVADRAFYAELNDRFRGYDALLYELVAPDGAVLADRDDSERSMISNVQLFMKDMLDLSFQLDEIDYRQPNFVHADLSPGELREQMKARGESLYTYFWRIIFASLRATSRDPLGLEGMRSVSRNQSLKASLAYEMSDLDTVLETVGGTALIASRNARAVTVLQDSLAAGHRRIGIFYGVAHMPDFETRLVDELSLRRDGVTWIDAWQLDEAAESGN